MNQHYRLIEKLYVHMTGHPDHVDTGNMTVLQQDELLMVMDDAAVSWAPDGGDLASKYEHTQYGWTVEVVRTDSLLEKDDA